MSRVADALKAAGIVSTASRFHEDDHPWATDLVRVEEDGALDAEEHLRFRPAAPAPDAAPAPVRTVPVEGALPRTPRDGEDVHHPLASLVDRVFLPVSGEPIRSVAFSSVGAGHANSGAITAAAARMLAGQTTARVCAVDGNFTSPSLHEHFAIGRAGGLGDALTSGRPLTDVARQIHENLWVVPGGESDWRSCASETARLHMAQFFARFDYVLVEMEPIAASGDTTGLAAIVGGVILVVVAEATRRESARRAAQILHASGASVIGAVLTNRRFPIPEALYRRL